jgi:hypothetical protein
MALTKLDDLNYLDLATLISVQFDESGSAKVQLLTGGSLVLLAKAAESLRLELQGDGITATHQDSTEDDGANGNFTLVSRKKGWFMLTENGLPYIVAAVSSKGSCSIRTFDGVTGAFRGKQYRSGDFADSFPQLRSARELTVPYQPNLERDCRERLPETLLNYLQEQFG